MAERGSFSSGGGEVELLVILPDGRRVPHSVHYNCPMMDLLIQIASKENLRPSAYVIEPLESSIEEEDHNAKDLIQYKPNTPIGTLNTQVIRLALKSTSKMSVSHTTAKSYDKKINHSESFSNRVSNFNKMAGVSAVSICNDPDGFNKLSEDTKRIKSRSNFITSTLPPQVTGDWRSGNQLLNTFRLQIHLPCDQLHVIRASPDDTIDDVLDIVREERGLKLERYIVYKTNDPDLQLSTKGTLKEYSITELTLKLRPEFEVKRSVNPKNVKKQNSSHFRSAFKSFFHQLKPSSRSNSVTELRHSTETVRPRNEIPTVDHTVSEFVKPRAPPRKRGQAPPPPPRVGDRTSTMSRSHTASESSCESACEGSVGGSAPATLPRRCRLGPESASTHDLCTEPPLPALRRGVSDMAVNKPKYPRRKRLAPKPPTPITNDELKEDGVEEQAAMQKTDEITSSHEAIPQLTEYSNSDNVKKDQIQPTQITGFIPSSKDIDNKDLQEQEKSTSPPDKPDNIITSCYDPVFAQNEYSEHNIVSVGKTTKSVDGTKYGHTEEKTGSQGQPQPYNHNMAKIEISLNGIPDENTQNSTNITPNDFVNENEPIKVNLQETKPLIINDFEPSKEDTFQFELPKEDTIKFKKEEKETEMLFKKDAEPFKETETEQLRQDVDLRNAPTASQASFQNVEPLPVVEKPESKVLPTFPRTVNHDNNNRQSFTLPSPKFKEISQTKTPPQRSVSSSGNVASKPTVEELLKQIQKIKEKSNTSETNDKNCNSRPYQEVRRNGFDQPEIVGHIVKLPPYDKFSTDNGYLKCVTPPVSPITVDAPELNGKGEEVKSQLVTDVVTKLYSVEKQVSDAPNCVRPLPSFMLTSWAEEKRMPVVNRIADYGSRSSTTPIAQTKDNDIPKESVRVSDRPKPFALSSTLPRPFVKPSECLPTTAMHKLPTIINVLEKTEVQKRNSFSNTNGRQSAYAKLNLYNMTPSILPEPTNSYTENGEGEVLKKPSWELVQDANKKFQESKTNGQHKEVEQDSSPLNDSYENGKNGKLYNEKLSENGARHDEESRNIYKYTKPMQFQLGTWNDKAKSMKIGGDVDIDKKKDPSLVKEIDEVAVWSATY